MSTSEPDLRSVMSRRGLLLGGGALVLGGVAAACAETDDGNGVGPSSRPAKGSPVAGATTAPIPARGTPGVGGGTVTVRDVRIFDGERLVDADSLIVEDGLVTALGRGLLPPDGSAVHDGGGGLLLPGLIDAHVHTNSLDQLGDSLRFGVSTVLDMFSLFGIGPQGVPLRAKRESLAPTDQADYWSAGYMSTAAGGHGTQYGIPVPALGPGDDVEAFVAARVADGGDYLKIVIEDGALINQPTPTLTADQVNALVAAAHERGLLAVVHVNTWDAAEIAMAAGADVLAHMPGGEAPDRDLLDRLVDAGIAVVATVAVHVAFSCTDDSSRLRDDPRIGPYLSEAQRAGLSGGVPSCPFAQLDHVLASVAAVHEAGVPILAGTDFSNLATAPGASLLLELEMLVRAGLDPVEALRSATAVPASVFGLDDRGKLEVGRRGDLVLVAGDPLNDITAMRDLAAVWKNGFPVDRAV